MPGKSPKTGRMAIFSEFNILTINISILAMIAGFSILPGQSQSLMDIGKSMGAFLIWFLPLQ
jgi:hypothetical protein